MYSLSRSLRFAAAAVAALALTGCASMNVNSYLERGNDFARYRTYNWAPPDAARNRRSPPRQQSVLPRADSGRRREQLATRGFEKTSSGVPDLLVRYRASVSQRVDVDRVDRDNGDCDNEGGLPAYVYDAGTLLIDFVDARTDKWSGAGGPRAAPDGVIDNQRLMEQKVDKAVTRILSGSRARSSAGEGRHASQSRRPSGSSCSSWRC